MREFDQAPFGIVGLETLIPITVIALIEPGHLTWMDVIRKLTVEPAKLLGIPKGTLRPGADADRDDHRPDHPVDYRPDEVPLQKPKYALWWIGKSAAEPTR